MLGEIGRSPSVLWQKFSFIIQKSRAVYSVRSLQLLLKYSALVIVKHREKLKLISIRTSDPSKKKKNSCIVLGSY